MRPGSVISQQETEGSKYKNRIKHVLNASRSSAFLEKLKICAENVWSNWSVRLVWLQGATKLVSETLASAGRNQTSL